MNTLGFGHSNFCDSSNVSQSRKFVNSTLLSRGYISEEHADLKYNSSDSHVVLNLIYTFLSKAEEENVRAEENALSLRMAKAREQLLESRVKGMSEKLAAIERENGIALNTITTLKNRLSKQEGEMRSLKDNLSKTTIALNNTRTQVSNDLRKRDIHIRKMKDLLADGVISRRDKISPSMTIQSNSSSLNNGASISAQSLTTRKCDPNCRQSDDFQQSSSLSNLRDEVESDLTAYSRELAMKVEGQSNLLQAVLNSLNHLLFTPLEISAHEGDSVQSSNQSLFVLEAQLKVRLTELKSVLEFPGYVPIAELQNRDEECEKLRKEVLKIKSEWDAAREVLEGLTKSVVEQKKSDYSKVLDSRINGRDDSNDREQSLDDLRLLAPVPQSLSHFHCRSAKLADLSSNDTAKMLFHNIEDDRQNPLNEVRVSPGEAERFKEQCRRGSRRITLGLSAKEDDLRRELEAIAH